MSAATPRVVVDPVTRIEGHLRIEAETDAEGRITHTVDRTGLWRAQTPQAFPRRMLEEAHVAARRDGVGATDDAALCERLGWPVVVVRGSERAMKITEEPDFARAEALSPLAE